MESNNNKWNSQLKYYKPKSLNNIAPYVNSAVIPWSITPYSDKNYSWSIYGLTNSIIDTQGNYHQNVYTYDKRTNK